MNNNEVDEKIARLKELQREMAENEKRIDEILMEERKGRNMYNKKVRFDGDIIITDPCYIMNKENDDRFDNKGGCNSPSWWDYVSKTTTTNCDDGKGGIYTRYNMPKAEDYPDCRVKVDSDYKSEAERILDKRMGRTVMFSPTLQAEWDAYYAASEKWMSVPHSDWDRCKCGEDMSVLGLRTYITGDTLYGDWSCHTFDSDTGEVLGEFCADSAMVGVFLLDEVLNYNPNFNYHTERPWTTTLIKDFHGTVELRVKSNENNRKHEKLNMIDDEVEVIGEGNINFIGQQTGL